MTYAELKDAVRNRWPSILAGIGVPSKFLKRKNGPCPFCGGTDRYRFTDWDGEGYWICNQCGSGNGIEFVKRYLKTDFKGAVERITPLIASAKVHKQRDVPEDARRQERKAIWQQSWPIQDGDPVDKYLFNRLAFHVRSSELRTYLADDGAIMIARVQNGEGNKVATIHRTFLTKDGEKIGRKIMPGEIDGKSVAVRLSPLDGNVLGIAEGIETALAAARLFGIPVWAALNEGNMRKWIPPEETQRIIIFADNDLNFVGQGAAYVCAGNCHKHGKQAEVKIPDSAGTDWNDILKMKQSAMAA